MEYSLEEKVLLWLSLIQNVNGYEKYSLYDEVESMLDVFNNFASYRNVIIKNCKESGYNKLAEIRDMTLIDKYIIALRQNNVGYLPITHDDYPERLLKIEDPPIGLFYRGDVSLLSAKYTLAVVGTRHTTRYGRDITKRLTADVSGHDIVIVSGLARGVDSIAHATCLDNYGKTIAVLGNGIDVVYPAENRELYEKIAERGIIVSEYPLKISPFPYNFPPRNRIISGLSDGVLITEAGKKSGTMITAEYAVDQCKDLFCVPGPIYAESSEGTNYLLSTKEAIFVRNSEDILNSYNIIIRNSEPSMIQLDFTEQAIVDEVKNEAKHFDELLDKSGLNVGELQSLLAGLEIQGIISKQPGNYYALEI